ncbi:MAG: flagellar assembly peptidoglycan hydrolase FlgJ [Gammaproteobacteria bacterium]|nr:flagellar assembly peptidoglycan hydrolase FlgJ [Gammaproteobacteria bacterium]
MAIADASVYTDFAGLTALKAKASKNQAAAVGEVARQFEAMFLQQMLKEMRKASPGDGIFDSSQSQFYREMYDQQLAQHLSKSGGIGLSEVLERQLGGKNEALAARDGLDNLPLISNGQPPMPIQGALQGAPLPLDNRIYPGRARVPVRQTAAGAEVPTQAPSQPSTASDKVARAGRGGAAENQPFTSAEDFVRRLRPHAQEAAAKLGVDADVLIAQAALESGWGRRQMYHPDGSSAHNLFGIKANRSWQGDKVAVSTLEYEGGVAVRKTEPFRSYASYRESFLDYANFILSNPRYGKALSVADNPRAYFSELQKAGYATDPGYADKLTSVLRSKHLK